MINTQELNEKIAYLISLLHSYEAEAKDIEASRAALEKSSFVNTDREKRLNDLQISLTQKEQDIASQRKYIDEQSGKNAGLLTTIQKEQEGLMITKAEREQFEKDNAYLKIREQTLEDKQLQYEKEKALMKKQEESTTELIQMLDAREKRIKAKEERLDNIERMTSL